MELHEQIQQYGTTSLSNEELLMTLLQGKAAPVRSLTQVRRLLKERGGLRGLLRTDFGELCQEYHLSPQIAARVQAAVELARRLASTAHEERPVIRLPNDAANLVMAAMSHLDHEEMRVLLLDTRNHVMANVLLYQGTLNGTSVRVAEVFRPAITRQAASIIVCHNHPSESLVPSEEDLLFTQHLQEAGTLLNVDLLDHLIIADGRYLSVVAWLNQSSDQ